jgi:D-alanyl-D-alanine carboxypeptidase
VTSAVRGGVRLIGVVLGAASNNERDLHMASLLDRGFEQMDVPVTRKPAVQLASRVTLIASAHAAEPVRPRPRAPQWAVQVGSFATEAAARGAANAARREADAGEARVEQVRFRNKLAWRALVVGLSASDAQDACSGHRKGTCSVIRPDSRQVASR